MESGNDLNAIVNQWIANLLSKIDKLLKANRRVCLIALSRKMPRFFDWLRRRPEGIDVDGLLEILKNPSVELTTEYAIPLIFNPKSRTNRENTTGIIIDDVVISGSTSCTVALEWDAASGRMPDFSTIFRCREATLFPALERDLPLDVPRMGYLQIIPYLKEISVRLIMSSLPIDIEYPIIHVQAPYGNLKRFIEEKCPDWKTYTVKSDLSDKVQESFTILLEDEKSHNYTNDFAKARLFPHDEESRLEIIAPNALCISNPDDYFNFSDNEYIQLWSDVWHLIMESSVAPRLESSTASVSESTLSVFFGQRKIMSLIVWTNYLMSLSSFIRNRRLLLPETVNVSVSVNDLSLILGSEVASDIVGRVNALIQRGIASESKRTRVTLPSYAISPELRKIYFQKVVEALKPEDDIASNLDSIFKITHFNGELKTVRGIGTSHNCVGESYESLMAHLLNFYYDDPEREVKVHRWMDQRIDESRITPKYEPVVGSDNKVYYRRFFFTGTNPF